MERLTKWENGHAYYPRCFENLCYGGGCVTRDCPFETAICERLAAYEDTGLTPEEVTAATVALMGKTLAEITEFEGVPLARLRELAEADKAGRCVVLPCKVGDIVYKLITIKAQKSVILETQIKTLGQAADVAQLIGKRNKIINVFLTREEAERAMQEMEGKKDG